MKTTYEYIVIGLGGIGAAAAYWLARQAGSELLGLEQFEIGHERGASQDHSRIIRLSYHTLAYVELARHAYSHWAELEVDAGEKLIVRTGGLDLTHPKATIPISDYTDSMTAAGVVYEWLDAAEIRYRWPQWRLDDDVSALYQEQSGIVPAARCNAAHLRLARAYGATLRDKAPVTAIRDTPGEIEVEAGGVTYHGRKLILAAGAWTNNLLAHFGRRLPLTVTQEQVVYYRSSHTADFMPDRFPIWIWMDVPCFYGFPVYGEGGPKVSEDAGGEPVTAETRTFEPNPAIRQRIDAFVQRYLPTAYGPPIRIKTCLYTMPPDRDFILDTLPGHPNVAVAVGAGHAFKFASLLGRILADLALTGDTAHDIEPFRLDRPILHQENPPKNFFV
jgi:sarcosine oxidase